MTITSEARRLTVQWRAALNAREANPYPTDAEDAVEQHRYDELVDFVEANGLNNTTHDPRQTGAGA